MNPMIEQDYTKRFDFGLWKKLFRYIKGYKKEAMILAVVMMGVGGIEAIFPMLTKEAVDRFVIPGTTKGLLGFALIYAALVVVQAFNVWLFIAIAGKMETGITYDIRKAGFQRLQELSFSYYDKTAVGWMMARMTSDIKRQIGRAHV